MTERSQIKRGKLRIAVVCLGNLWRGDDAVGLCAAAPLARRVGDNAHVIMHTGDVFALIDDWAQVDILLCLDAAAPTGVPGRIHRVDISARNSGVKRDVSLPSSHGLGLAHAIALAGELGQLPSEVVLFAVEGACFDIGAELTPSVADAIPNVVEAVVAEVTRHVTANPV